MRTNHPHVLTHKKTLRPPLVESILSLLVIVFLKTLESRDKIGEELLGDVDEVFHLVSVRLELGRVVLRCPDKTSTNNKSNQTTHSLGQEKTISPSRSVIPSKLACWKLNSSYAPVNQQTTKQNKANLFRLHHGQRFGARNLLHDGIDGSLLPLGHGALDGAFR